MNSLKNAQLQHICRLIGAPSSGTKSVLCDSIVTQRGVLLATPPDATIISVDLGLKNIGVCGLQLQSDNRPVVRAWALCDLLNPPLAYPAFAHAAAQLAHTLMTFTGTKPAEKPHTILIERQRSRSAGAAAVPHDILRINVLEGMLHAALLCKYPHVKVASVDPKNVLGYWKYALNLPKTSTYRESKNQRLGLVSNWLAQPETAPFTLDSSVEVRKRGKKDDLNDALAQAITWNAWMQNAKTLDIP